MSEELKKTVIEYFREKKYGLIINEKYYKYDKIINEIENDTEVGKFIVGLIIRWTIDRYSKK
jgi:hypothetical protein